MTVDPLDLMAGFVLDTGQTWGEVAHDWQHDDVAAVLGTGDDSDSPESPRRHYLLRGRGMSKTTDVAALTLALLLAEAPARSRSHMYAVDAEQARLFMDAVDGLVGRTSGLAAAVEVSARSVTVRSTGASLTVETSDGASAYGTRPWLTVVDELGAWPSTSNHQRLWSAIISAVPKVPGSRLLVIGTAGSPTGLGAEVWKKATTSTGWRTSRHPGPSPWWTPADIAETQADLSPAEWSRLILCEWAEGDDALTTAEDVDACIRTTSTPITARQPGREYVAALDVGTRRDLTALVVGHAERRDTGRVTVIDRVLYWRPKDNGGRVDLAEVEAATLNLCREYRARLRFDRMQAEQLTTNLDRSGITTEEFVFSAAGANRLARALFGALRDRAVSLPDDPEVRAEFLATRMIETGPSTVKIQNPPGQHDDIVTAVGMVVADLSERPETGRGFITVPGQRTTSTNPLSGPSRNGLTSAPVPPVKRSNLGGRPQIPADAAARLAARRGPRGVNGVVPIPARSRNRR